MQKIAENFGNLCYIKQFDLVARNDAHDKARFNKVLSQKESLFSEEFLKDFRKVVNDMIEVDIQQDLRQVSDYLDTLIRFAKETEKHDAFSKAALYREDKYPIIEQGGLSELISSTKNLLKNVEFRDVIDKRIAYQKLKELYIDLITIYQKREEQKRKEAWINSLVDQVKKKLQQRTAAPIISEMNPYSILMNQVKVKKFNNLVKEVRKPREIMRKRQGSFELVANVSEFKRAGELKAQSKSMIAFSGAYENYGRPFAFLQSLKTLDSSIQPSDYYKYFAKIDYKILNKDGLEASGGERSEFFLIEEIEKAHSYDMLLIDEPESSFDNKFLKKDVNSKIKEISKDMPVVLVTHNNTVGASIKPDYLICSRKEVDGKNISWRTFTGYPTDKTLKSLDQTEVNTWEVYMDCLEGGSDTYDERAQSYADIKN